MKERERKRQEEYKYYNIMNGEGLSASYCEFVQRQHKSYRYNGHVEKRKKKTVTWCLKIRISKDLSRSQCLHTTIRYEAKRCGQNQCWL